MPDTSSVYRCENLVPDPNHGKSAVIAGLSSDSDFGKWLSIGSPQPIFEIGKSYSIDVREVSVE